MSTVPKHTRRLVALLVLTAVAGLAPRPASGQAPPEIRWEPYLLEAGEEQVDTLELGRMLVPERRGSAGEGTVELAFVRLQSRSSSPGAPIVYLDGGPGGSGVGVAEIPAYYQLFDTLRDGADVILLSQRGTGLSRPRLGCPLGEPAPADILTTRERLLEVFRPSVEACVETWRARGVELAGYTTTESADDLDDLRRALGAERISLLGFSYGTHLGLSAIRRHGPRIERAVLIGTEGPDHTYKLPSTPDRQLRHLAWMAARDPEGAAATPDLYAAVDSLLRQLDQEPSPLEIRTPEGSTTILLGGDGLRYLLMRDFGDTNDHPLWPAAIRLMLDGEPGLMAALAGRRYQEMVGVPLMGLLMDCASGATPRRLARIRDEEPASIAGTMTNQWFPEICDALPDVRLPAEHRTTFVSDVPTLFLSGGMDANTPPHQAREVAWGWPRATHLVVEHAGHESVMPHPEIQAVIRDFFSGQDVSDRQIRLSPVDFIGVERARSLVGGP